MQTNQENLYVNQNKNYHENIFVKKISNNSNNSTISNNSTKNGNIYQYTKQKINEECQKSIILYKEYKENLLFRKLTDNNFLPNNSDENYIPKLVNFFQHIRNINTPSDIY